MRLSLTSGLLLLPLALSLFAAEPVVPLSKSEITFVQKATLYNLAEVRAAEIALRRNLTAQEQAYAQELVRQHTQAYQELASMAKQKGILISEILPSDMQDELTELAAYRDPEFNERFLEERIACHRQALRYLEDVSEDSKDADLRRYADNGLISVRQHLETAQDLEARY
jgi:putative membrane protein